MFLLFKKKNSLKLSFHFLDAVEGRRVIGSRWRETWGQRRFCLEGRYLLMFITGGKEPSGEGRAEDQGRGGHCWRKVLEENRGKHESPSRARVVLPRYLCFQRTALRIHSPPALQIQLQPTHCIRSMRFPSPRWWLPSLDDMNTEPSGEPVKNTRSQDPTPGAFNFIVLNFDVHRNSPGSLLKLQNLIRWV